MKRTIGLIILFAMLLSVAAYAADTKTVRIDELDLSVDVPSKYTAITQDSASYAISDGLEDTQQWMKENQFYLLLQNGDPRFECKLVAASNPLERMDQFDDAVLEEQLEETRSRFEEQLVSVSSATLFHTDETVFFRIDGSARDSDGNLLQTLLYSTIYNHQSLNFAVQFEGEEMPEQYRTLGDAIITSLRFGADPGPVQESTVFRDSVTGASFTVPADWITVELDGGDYFDGEHPPLTFAGFFCPDNAVEVQYVCYDLMEQLPDLIGKLLPRERVDQEHVSIEAIKRSIPYDVQSAQTQTIGGRDFYILEIAGTAETDGVEKAFTVTDAMYIQNGYEYSFKFSDTADHPRYAEFLSMLETAEFPEALPVESEAQEETVEEAAEEPAADAAEVVAAEEPAAAEDTAAAEAPSGMPDPARAFRIGMIAGRITRAVLILAAIVTAIVLLAKNRKKKARQPAGAVPDLPAAIAAPAAPAKRECAACGAGLSPDEAVCPYCGTEAK